MLIFNKFQNRSQKCFCFHFNSFEGIERAAVSCASANLKLFFSLKRQKTTILWPSLFPSLFMTQLYSKYGTVYDKARSINHQQSRKSNRTKMKFPLSEKFNWKNYPHSEFCHICHEFFLYVLTTMLFVCVMQILWSCKLNKFFYKTNKWMKLNWKGILKAHLQIKWEIICGHKCQI